MTFTAGFNRSYGQTGFVDAGELKENADFKLKAMLKLAKKPRQGDEVGVDATYDVVALKSLAAKTGFDSIISSVSLPWLESKQVRLHNSSYPCYSSRSALV
jgi:hypothetical protein